MEPRSPPAANGEGVGVHYSSDSNTHYSSDNNTDTRQFRMQFTEVKLWMDNGAPRGAAMRRSNAATFREVFAFDDLDHDAESGAAGTLSLSVIRTFSIRRVLNWNTRTPVVTEADALQRFLGTENALIRLQPQSELGRLLKLIFAVDYVDQLAGDQSPRELAADRFRVRRAARRIVDGALFTLAFQLLTVYVIFSYDLTTIFLYKQHEEPILIINSVVFSLFLLELVLLVLGRQRYICTINFLFDAICLVSLLGDTWFVNKALFGEQGSRIGRLTRSTRMTRLIKVVRIARITKMIPWLVQLFRRQNMDLARRVLSRQLWRVFLYLDVDCDGKVSLTDLKMFYLTFLKVCPHLPQGRLSTLVADTRILSGGEPAGGESGGDAPEVPGVSQDTCNLGFQDFLGIFMRTRAGKSVVRSYRRGIEHEEGVWKLTQKLSDKTSLKVCICVLVMIGVMSLLEVQVQEQDQSIRQSLAQMDTMARLEHAGGDLASAAHLCAQVRVHARYHRTLSLFLDGRTYVRDGGPCLEPGIGEAELDPFAHVSQVVRDSRLREAELLHVCWPDENCSPAGTTSMSLVDQSAVVRENAWRSLATIVSIIALLFLFIYVMKTKISNFTRTILHPLRILADDMITISSLDLVHIDRDPPVDAEKPLRMSTELQEVHTTFKSMRSAVRSWSKFVPPCVVQQLLNDGMEATIGVATCLATILFCDIDGFEAASQGLRPEEVLSLLSAALGRIAEVIQNNGGTLLEFSGEEVLAAFNTPVALEGHELAGVEACQEIHEAFATFPLVASESGGGARIKCRCGVHTGQILAGNIGSMTRMKYGFLGDSINLAARIKTLNSRYCTRTLASDSVFRSELVTGSVLYRPVDIVAVKGKNKSTLVYEILDASVNQRIDTAAQAHREAFKLYQERRFEEAIVLFAEVGRQFADIGVPCDEPSQLLLSRCEAYLEEPPPPEWDGVDRLNKKSWEIQGHRKRTRTKVFSEANSVRVIDIDAEGTTDRRRASSSSGWPSCVCSPLAVSEHA